VKELFALQIGFAFPPPTINSGSRKLKIAIKLLISYASHPD